MPTPSLPSVAVLLATRNGLRWLPEQLASILDQRGVIVRVLALDDESTDGTREWLIEQAAIEPRLTVLPSMGASGSSAANFYRLTRVAELRPDELVAYADQDDIWRQGKLERHARLITEGGFDGVSSDVTSFEPDGRRSLVRKSFPQRPFDYLFESPGPGSTFLITPKLLTVVRQVLSGELAAGIDFHDSLIYAVARAAGLRWHIDDWSSVDYRQHADNVMGANVGARPALARLRLIREQWHRRHATTLARIGLTVAADETRAGLQDMLELLERRGPRARVTLARRAGSLRRRRRDQWIIGLLIATGVW